jgi:hypothetical protein
MKYQDVPKRAGRNQESSTAARPPGIVMASTLALSIETIKLGLVS